MSQPEPAARRIPRYGRYVGPARRSLILVLITINTILTKPNGVDGHRAGATAAAVRGPARAGQPATATPTSPTHADEGAAGRVPGVQGARPADPQRLPALRTAPRSCSRCSSTRGSCPAVLGDMQALARSFPGVRFAAVAIKGDRAQMRRLIRSRGLTLPWGSTKTARWRRCTRSRRCPQVTFAYPGGGCRARRCSTRPSRATLRARVAELVAASRARGWSSAPARGAA